jgi:hypothetical protein
MTLACRGEARGKATGARLKGGIRLVRPVIRPNR